MKIQIWQHIRSGEKYVVEVNVDGVKAASGPLHHSEIADARHYGVINNDPDLVEWLNENDRIFNLYEPS